MKNIKQNVYGYIRVSTETQADKGYGLDIQKSGIQEYCDKNNLNLLNIFIDAGKSGTIGDSDDFSSRPALVELLKTIKSKSIIIVMNKSRLWRDGTARVYISRAVKKLNGEILSIEEPSYSLYSKDPHDFLVNSLMEMLDEYDRMCTNMRLTKGKNEKAKQGYKPAGRAPLGYQWNKETNQIEINPQEANIVKKIFELNKVKYGYQEIVNILTAENIFTKNNKPFTKQSIRVILQNKFYTGTLTHQGEEIKGQHTPIIDANVL